jgi:GNAT superfamily N-acetyltransferase
MSSVIRPASYAEILDAPNAQELLDAYAAECSIPEIGSTAPQSETYSMLEQSGALHCFGVYADEQLVGFAAVLLPILPHYSRKVATIESIFVAQEHRAGIGRALLLAIEQFSKLQGCEAVLYTAPAGSRFDALLAHSSVYRHTNNVYCRSLS